MRMRQPLKVRRKMASVSLILFLFVQLLITVAECQKKSKDKIVIHVPYKILNHHHTHTNYKVIPVPAPKHENTVIYLKKIQPLVKQFPHIKIQEVIKPQIKTQELIEPHIKIQEVIKPQIKTQELIEPHIKIQELIKPQIKIQELIKTQELIEPHIKTQELIQPHINTQELIQPLIKTQELIQPHIKTQELIQPHINTQELIQPLIKTQELIQPHIKTQELIEPHIKTQELIESHIKTQELIEPQAKIPELIIPPHQQSASALLENLANHKEEIHQQYSNIDEEHKTIETESQKIPNLTFKPMIFPPHKNVIPNFPIHVRQPIFTSKLLLSPIMNQPIGSLIPKLYHPILHLMQGHYPNFKYKAMNHFQDNAHTSSQLHKTIIAPGTKAAYKVKEEFQEDHYKQPIKHITVPSKTSTRKGKSYLVPSQNLRFKSIRSIMQPDPDYEYEHVGYLIIDGNKKKVVGKNFKEGIHLSR